MYAGHMLELYGRVRQTVGAALEAGVPVYAGTDAGGGIAHGRIVDEIVALHEMGMTTRTRLGAASWAARSWLGWSGASRRARRRTSSPTTRTRGTDLNALRHPSRIVLRGRVIR